MSGLWDADRWRGDGGRRGIGQLTKEEIELEGEDHLILDISDIVARIRD